MARGESRMRNFQRALIAEGKRLKAWRFSKVIDVDHANDIPKAEELVAPFLFVLRAPEYSPGRVDDDREIMMAVKARAGVGAVVREEELSKVTCCPSFVFSMARRPESLERLRQWEAQGTKVINPPEGVENCRRSRIENLMRKHELPTPPQEGLCGYWLKRGDTSVTRAGELLYCKDKEELEKGKRLFAQQGITDYVVQAHVEGEVVKFYGVEGRGFWLTQTGTLTLTGTLNTLSNLKKRIREAAEKVSRLANVPVYGGDAVVTSDGDFYIIDFNDWPSFSMCREEAASKLAKLRKM